MAVDQLRFAPQAPAVLSEPLLTPVEAAALLAVRRSWIYDAARAASSRASALDGTSVSCAPTSSAGSPSNGPDPLPASHLARVAVDDATWRQFRQIALIRDRSIAAYLGALVRDELRRRRQRPVAAIVADAPREDQALIALRDVRAAIDELDDIAGRLARTAIDQGASWQDVGSSLRIAPEAAERAYDARG